jgi:hypothetical protein
MWKIKQVLQLLWLLFVWLHLTKQANEWTLKLLKSFKSYNIVLLPLKCKMFFKPSLGAPIVV